MTNKLARLFLGDRVWLITGMTKGGRKPCNYFLCETFVVDKLESLKSGKFKYKVSGSEGKSFKNRVEIDSAPWFPQLRRLAGNFGFGLQPIRSRMVVRGLERLIS